MRRPRLTLGIWLALVAFLGTQAIHAEQRLGSPSYTIPGTIAADGIELDAQSFGSTINFPVLLTGPPAAVEREGPRLVRALAATGHIRALSPWDPGVEARRLRPSPHAAMVVAIVERPPEDALKVAVPEVKKIVADTVHGRVVAHVTGQAVIGDALQHSSLSATQEAEKIALPALLIVLLLVFGSPIAAAIPAVFGVATVISGFGTLALIALVTPIEALAITLASMVGLALGVDYSLLIVSRFREELAEGREPAEAATRAAGTAGRTVVFAGGALVAAMTFAVLVSPGSLLLSASLGVVVVGVLSVLAAIVVLPALLAMVGPGVNRWNIWGSRRRSGSFFATVAARVGQRPLLTALLILVGVLALCAPALALNTNTPGVGQLPEDSSARKDFETISRVMGPGWGAPLGVVVVAPGGNIATSQRLKALISLQKEIGGMGNVQTLFGPASVARATKPVRRLPQRAERLKTDYAKGRHDVARLDRGLGDAGTGVTQVRDGLSEAARGADRLDDGAAAAATGARQIEDGLGAALAGSRRLDAGLGTAAAGARRHDEGAGRARAGSDKLARDIGRAQHAVALAVHAETVLVLGLRRGARRTGDLREAAQTADENLKIAFRSLQAMTVGKFDPRYARTLEAVATASGAVSGRDPFTGDPVRAGYHGLDRSLVEIQAGFATSAAGAAALRESTRELRDGLGQLHAGALRLSNGIERLRQGAAQLASGTGQLSNGAGSLASGLSRLDAGARRLAPAITSLSNGAGRLRDGLDSGYRRSGRLSTGVRVMHDKVGKFRDKMPETVPGLTQLQRRSPGFLRSGYLTIAALDGAKPADRARSELLLNLDRGGSAARFIIIPKTGGQSPATSQSELKLAGIVSRFSARTHLASGVNGEAALLADYQRTTESRLPLLFAGLAFVTFLILVPMLRAILLPLIAVLLNLLTVAAAFGVLSLLFSGSAPLGGPGYVDIISVAGIFVIVFGLSIDYAVFLLTRMRENYVVSGSTDEAIRYGLTHTARVVTGAAAIMASVFLAFSTTSFVPVRAFGIGLTVAVVLDATVIRLLLLPALMKLLGPAAWWMPAWLDRALPHFDIERSDDADPPNGGDSPNARIFPDRTSTVDWRSVERQLHAVD